jgi:Tfp pilus assembly protein PilV
MVTLLAAVIVAAAVLCAAAMIAREMRMSRDRAAQVRALDLVALFAPGIAAAADDPRAFLAWQPRSERDISLHQLAD